VRKRGISLALFFGGCGFAFLLGETILRVFGISYPYFYIPDQITGYSHKPGAEGLWHKEGNAYIRINSAGLRDREHDLKKPPKTFRMAVLGDSYAEAMQLPMAQTFWVRLEKELSGCPAFAGQRIEVVNFGVSGFNTGQELLVLRHKIPSYHPDLVLLAFYTGNDIRGNSRELDGHNIRPYFTIREGRLVLDNSFRRSTEFKLQQLPLSSEAFEYSRMLQVFREAKYRLKAILMQAKHQQRMQNRTGPDVDLDMMVYLKPKDPVWEEAWMITEKLIQLASQEAGENKYGFLLVTLSNPDQVHPDLEHRRALARYLGVGDLYYPVRRIQALAEREGIELLSLAEPLAAYSEEQNKFLHGFPNAQVGVGHWNASAHRFAGQLMAERICDMYQSSGKANRA
jgi:hypothetical protein